MCVSVPRGLGAHEPAERALQPEWVAAPVAPAALQLPPYSLEVMAVAPSRREPSPIVTAILDLFEDAIAEFERRLDLRLADG